MGIARLKSQNVIRRLKNDILRIPKTMQALQYDVYNSQQEIRSVQGVLEAKKPCKTPQKWLNKRI